MSRLHTGAVSALVLAFALSATTANAQQFRGFRVEGQVGYSQFNAAGDHDGHVGVGAAAGADWDLGGFVLGAEGTFWWAPAEVHTIDGPGVVDHKTFEEWGLAARAGFMVTPSTLVYGKLGYVNNEQRKRFTPINPANGELDSSYPGYYYHHFHQSGYVWGAGIDQMLGNNLYASVEGRYSRYGDHTHTVTGLIGLGYMFGASAPVPPPPPPPPPPPATQTCPDGSVIAVTATCPAPPPPPPPPAPVERGERG